MRCPACDMPLSLTVDDVTVDSDGHVVVGCQQADVALRLHLRYGCP